MATKEFRLEHFRTENQKVPMGLDCKNPRFSWELHSQEENVFQSAYQIKITDPKGNVVAETGKVTDKNNVLVEVKDLQLAPMTAYQVYVKVWNDRQETAEIIGSFETGS